MLTRDDNELLVRVGKDTPMGNLLRRFWIPALLADEVKDPDGPPVRVQLLGEDLVAFRGTDGRVGLLSAYCPHRRANLFWGRNEECGLRCVYHGWKFDVDGNCVDIPNISSGDRILHSYGTLAYPTVERGGFIWAYLGPRDLKPGFPATPVFALPDTHRFIQKVVLRGNWFQFMEGDIDSSHASILHSRLDNRPPVPGTFQAEYGFTDRTPKIIVTSTDYGIRSAARREAGPASYSWRITQWLLPFATLIPAAKGSAFITNIRIPMDDEHTMNFRMLANPERPLSKDDWGMVHGGVLFPEMIPGTFQTKANIDNDYLIDRHDQKTNSYTGIRSVPVQDYAVTQDVGGGPIADRSLERLIESDVTITAVRRRMLQRVKALRDGQNPPEAANPECYRVRSMEMMAPRDMDVDGAIERWAMTETAHAGQ